MSCILWFCILSIFRQCFGSIQLQQNQSTDLTDVERLLLWYNAENEIFQTELRRLKSDAKELVQTFRDRSGRSSHEEGIRSAHSTHHIGFTASMVQHNENLSLQDTVKFQNLITNDGNGFDSISGIFRAPIAGLYYFNVVILSHVTEDMETEIVKNGVGTVRTYSGDSTTWNSGTQSTTLYLELGDEVWVRILSAVPSVNNGNVRVFGYGFSSFSGFLISE